MKVGNLNDIGIKLKMDSDNQLSRALDKLIRLSEKKDIFKIGGKVKTLRERTLYIHSKVEDILQDCARLTVLDTPPVFNAVSDALSKLKFDNIFNEINFGSLIKICDAFELFEKLPEVDKQKTSERKKIENLNTLRNKLIHPGRLLKKTSSQIANDYKTLVEGFVVAQEVKERVYDKIRKQLSSRKP